MNILHRGPNNREATGLRGKRIDLIGALSHIAKKALNGVGAADVTVHHLWKSIKRQEMLFVLSQTAYRGHG
jgi:hypothetical protein